MDVRSAWRRAAQSLLESGLEGRAGQRQPGAFRTGCGGPTCRVLTRRCPREPRFSVRDSADSHPANSRLLFPPRSSPRHVPGAKRLIFVTECPLQGAEAPPGQAFCWSRSLASPVPHGCTDQEHKERSAPCPPLSPGPPPEGKGRRGRVPSARLVSQSPQSNAGLSHSAAQPCPDTQDRPRLWVSQVTLTRPLA